MIRVHRASTVLSAILVVLCALAGQAVAAPARVLVLPLEGNADAATRAKFSASVQRLARVLGGKLTTGDATFTDTATAIGCDPQAPSCAEDVRATLGVDELVYGTVTKQGGQNTLVVRRVGKGHPPREVTATLQASDSAERVEPAVLPLFHDDGSSRVDRPPNPPDSPNPPNPPLEGPPHPPPPPPSTSTTKSRRDRTLAIAAMAGGGTMVLISLALWASASGLKSDIANHPVETYSDFENLREIEDTARSRAWTGNAMFVAGAAVGALGGWMFYRDRKRRMAIAPARVEGGGGITITWRGGLP